MKRFLSVLLVAMLIVTSLATVAFAATEESGTIKVQTGDVKTFTVTVSGDEFGNYGIQLSADTGLKITAISDAVTANLSNGKVAWAKNSNNNAWNVTSHVFEVTVEVTATEPGTYEVKADVLKATKFVGVDKDTDDIKDGWVAASVSANGATFEIVEPECEHTWDEGKVTVEPTCSKDGVKTYTCSKCGMTKTESIPATGKHAYSNWAVTKAPTCTEKGEESRKCASCGHTETREVAATGHNYGDWKVTKEATCTEAGERTKTCANCGDKVTEAIAATGHSWGPWETVKEATETEDGLMKRTCLNCGHVEEKVIPAGMDDVPETRDMTPAFVLVALLTVALISLLVFKRRAVK